MNQMFNPMQIINAIKTGNPQQIAMNLLKNNSNMPFANNMMQMIQRGDQKGLEQMARNLAREKNVDIEQMINQFKNIK